MGFWIFRRKIISSWWQILGSKHYAWKNGKGKGRSTKGDNKRPFWYCVKAYTLIQECTRSHSPKIKHRIHIFMESKNKIQILSDLSKFCSFYFCSNIISLESLLPVSMVWRATFQSEGPGFISHQGQGAILSHF